MESYRKESVFDELSNFEKKKIQAESSPILDDYLARIAKTGDPEFPWLKLKPLFRHKLDKVIVDFNETYPARDLPHSANVEKFEFEEMHLKLLKTVDEFSGTPFTIQRLCELIISPYKQYKRADKFMRALEKDLLVVSTIEPSAHRTKNDSDSLVNGVYESGSSYNVATNSSHHPSSTDDGLSPLKDTERESPNKGNPQQNVVTESISELNPVVVECVDEIQCHSENSILLKVDQDDKPSRGEIEKQTSSEESSNDTKILQVDSSSEQTLEIHNVTSYQEDLTGNCQEMHNHDNSGCTTTNNVVNQCVVNEEVPLEEPEKRVVDAEFNCDSTVERRGSSDTPSMFESVVLPSSSTSQDIPIEMETEQTIIAEPSGSCETENLLANDSESEIMD